MQREPIPSLFARLNYWASIAERGQLEEGPPGLRRRHAADVGADRDQDQRGGEAQLRLLRGWVGVGLGLRHLGYAGPARVHLRLGDGPSSRLRGAERRCVRHRDAALVGDQITVNSVEARL